MKESALSLANFIVGKAHEEGADIQPLKLMKLVYIAHGYSLALLGRSALNPRFDKVEAWRLGPVIPSVYHSFKHYGCSAVKDKTVVLREKGEDVEVCVPELRDEELCEVAKLVWKRYKHMSGGELVELLHRPATPWSMTYKEGENVEIPDRLTRVYYSILIDKMLNGEK